MVNVTDRSGALRGHYWTVRMGALGWLPGVRSLVYPAPTSIPWSTRGHVARWGEVTLSGKWTRCGSRALLLVLHGLGGDADAPYVRHLAYFAARRGLDCLRLNFRGADRSGAGLYHCVASDDVALALADVSLRDYRDVFVAGHSLGGQVALHYASGAPDPRLRAVAAVCPPLDLVALSPYLEASAYRPLMLANMNRTYRRFWQARGQFLGSLFEHPDRVVRYRRLHDWDDAVTARYGGFTDAQHYYAVGSIGDRWSQLRVPTAAYLMDDDPIVPARALQACLREMRTHVELFRLPGGHLAAPHVRARRGEREPLPQQIVRWFIAI